MHLGPTCRVSNDLRKSYCCGIYDGLISEYIISFSCPAFLAPPILTYFSSFDLIFMHRDEVFISSRLLLPSHPYSKPKFFVALL